MEQDTKVDKEYIEAFNQGYTLSKELGLKSEILKGLSSGKNRIQAMKDGMEQHGKEITQTLQKEQDKEIIPSIDIDAIGNRSMAMDFNRLPDKDKGMDLEL